CGVLNGAITDARLRWQQWHPGLGACPRLPNDAWLPLLLVERGAPAALAALAGHHALAVVDGGRDALVLARDAMGEKPLWVARAGGRVVAFASTLPALAALGVAAELPAAAVAEFFARGSAGSAVAADPDLTLHDDLAGVDAGERLVPRAAPLGAAHASAGDLAAALTAATARCADAAEPLALCLSGGLDSSCLAAVLGELGRKVRGYQFRAAGDPGDERAAAAAVAAHTGLALRPVDGGPEVLDPLPRLTAHWGLPLGDPSVLALHALANAAAADGVRVLLSGEGSDEALLGYARHRALALLPRRGLRWLPAPAWSMRRAARAWRALAAADPYAELLAVPPPAFRREVLTGDVATAPPLPEGPGADPLQRARRLDQRWYLRRDLLPKLDVAAMAAQVEGRCPYLDAAFRAAAAAIPERRALGKAPLRAAFAARPPAGGTAQKKRGFARPLHRWFRRQRPW